MEETLLLKDLNCPNCAAKIEDRICKMDVVETANFTLATHQLKLTGLGRTVRLLSVTFKTSVMLSKRA